MLIQVDLRQVVYALSDALDLVGMNDFYHGKRVSLMAVRVARTLGLDDAIRDDLFNSGLLHDCGVSSTAIHQHLVEEMDWAGSQDHCEIGYRLLASFGYLRSLAPLVLYHHTHWRDFARMDVAPELARLANLIFLADRADALAAPHLGPTLLLHKQAILDTLASYRGEMFAPDLLDAFLETARSDAFWLVLEPRHIQNFLGEMLHRSQPQVLNFVELRQMAMLFSRVVDAKSPFTAAHSLGVARLARLLGELDGLGEDARDQLELAGLMHDLGKLQVPDEILDKPGPLNASERLVMERHSFETYQILSRIPGLHEVAAWAAYHHETLDGSGYPYSLVGGGLPREARIVAVADVFQAMAQNRPYRSSVPPVQILENLQQRARNGQLDASVIELVARHLDACWRAAIDGEEIPATPPP
ncbi:MAG: HD domain-containing protein [Gallionellaceae bacterium]|nr:HD domain-containing protein [Gallionellaceae bacterium]